MAFFFSVGFCSPSGPLDDRPCAYSYRHARYFSKALIEPLEAQAPKI